VTVCTLKIRYFAHGAFLLLNRVSERGREGVMYQ
jgi:hypothetical protein